MLFDNIRKVREAPLQDFTKSKEVLDLYEKAGKIPDFLIALYLKEDHAFITISNAEVVLQKE